MNIWLTWSISKNKIAKLNLKASKCHLFKDKLFYLFHIITAEGIGPDPDKIKEIVKLPKTKNHLYLKIIRYLLILTNIYSAFR